TQPSKSSGMPMGVAGEPSLASPSMLQRCLQPKAATKRRGNGQNFRSAVLGAGKRGLRKQKDRQTNSSTLSMRQNAKHHHQKRVALGAIRRTQMHNRANFLDNHDR